MAGDPLGGDILWRDALESADGFNEKIASRKRTTANEIDILRATDNLGEDIFNLRV
jgi:hypothetical protein